MGSSLSTEETNSAQENAVERETTHLHRMSLEAQNFQPKRLRKPRVTILTEILSKKVKLNDDEVKENNAILMEFLDTFIPEMKKHDRTFDLLHQRIYFTGSFYSDLRVSKPDEYDLNIVLKLPFKSQNVSVQYNTQVPSYVKYHTTDSANISQKGLTKLFDDGYLIPDKVRIWLQSVVDKARNTYKCPRNILGIRLSGSGPARTVILMKRNGQIDIDLVPAIECSIGQNPPGIDGRVFSKVGANLGCFLVPKPYNPPKQAPVNDTERKRLWRSHYPDAEAELIHNRGCLKPVIKLLKLLRDKEDWKILASYYLKTIIMWMIVEDQNLDWNMVKIGERFEDALRKLADCVKDRRLRYFFSSRYNLLEKLEKAQADIIYHRLLNILKKMERDDNSLWEIFGCSPTFSI